MYIDYITFLTKLNNFCINLHSINRQKPGRASICLYYTWFKWRDDSVSCQFSQNLLNFLFGFGTFMLTIFYFLRLCNYCVLFYINILPFYVIYKALCQEKQLKLCWFHVSPRVCLDKAFFKFATLHFRSDVLDTKCLNFSLHSFYN